MRHPFSRAGVVALIVAATTSTVRAQVSGQIHEIATLGRYESLGWVTATSDGKTLLVAADTTLLMIDVRAGRPSVIARGEFTHLSLSPQGTHIAFDRELGDSRAIWLARIDLRRGVVDSARQLVASGNSPMFSPDGQSIAFSREFAAAESLAIVPIAAGPVRTLPAGGAGAATVGWTPDGTSLYFAARKGPRDRIFPIGRVRLTDNSVTPVLAQNFLRRARLSPDGSRILYAPTTETFAVATADGAPVSFLPVEQQGAGRTISPPEWVGSGSAVAFTSLAEQRVLIAHDLADGTARRLTDGTSWIAASAVSPDNSQAAAITSQDGPARLLIVGMTGSGARTISTARPIAQNAQNAVLRWSPDGRFVAVPTGNIDKTVSHPNPMGIDLVEVATGRVTTLDISHEVLRYVWTPDSRAIRYTHGEQDAAGRVTLLEAREASIQGGNQRVRDLPRAGATAFRDFESVYLREDGALVHLRSGAIRVLVPPSEFPTAPVLPLSCFSPDGQWMAMPTSAARRGQYDRVMVVAVATGERRILDAGLRATQPGAVSCVADNRHVIVTGIDSTGTPRAVLLSLETGTHRPVAEVDHDLIGWIHYAISPDARTLLVSRSQPRNPLKLLLLERSEKR